MKAEEYRYLLICNLSSKLSISESDVKKAIESKSSNSLLVLVELEKEKKRYLKITEDYLKVVRSVVNASTVTYQYSHDMKYLKEINSAIDSISNNFKHKNYNR